MSEFTILRFPEHQHEILQNRSLNCNHHPSLSLADLSIHISGFPNFCCHLRMGHSTILLKKHEKTIHHAPGCTQADRKVQKSTMKKSKQRGMPTCSICFSQRMVGKSFSNVFLVPMPAQSCEAMWFFSSLSGGVGTEGSEIPDLFSPGGLRKLAKCQKSQEILQENHGTSRFCRKSCRNSWKLQIFEKFFISCRVIFPCQVYQRRIHQFIQEVKSDTPQLDPCMGSL